MAIAARPGRDDEALVGATPLPGFCHTCEAVCGTVTWVKDGKVVKITGDADNPWSKGYACPKVSVDQQFTYDPDRVTTPLQRQADGSFAPVAWDVALDDIATRLRTVIDTHGPGSVAGYLGNPSGWNYTLFFAVFSLIKGLGSEHLYTSGSVDIQQRWVVSQLLYGNPFRSPVPDIPRTDFHLLIGSNAFISHGSMCTQPRIADAMRAIVARGGRVVVVDPRRTETAKAFEWLPVRADTDAWMLLSMLQVIFGEKLEDTAAVERDATGLEPLRAFVADYPPEATEEITGIPAGQLRQLARDLAAAPTAAIHGRCGASLGKYSTVVTYLLDALAIVTGNLDRPGGSVFGKPAIDLELLLKLFKIDTYGSFHSRLGGFPEVLGTLPATELSRQITTPGKGQVRALFLASANPVNTTAGGEELDAALGQLDLFVSLDIYAHESNLRADYILPDVTAVEREDFPWFVMQHMTVPYMQWTKAAVAPAGEARPSAWAVDQICRRARIAPSPLAAGRVGWRLGVRPQPHTVMDLFLRTGPYGDMFGLRRKGPRLSRKKLLANPRGFVLSDYLPTGELRKKLPHKDGKVRLDQPVILADLQRLAAHQPAGDDLPLRLISLRELRSQNSRIHNLERLMRNRTQRLRMHPADAADAGVADGDLVAVTSRRGRVEVPVTVTDEMMPGNVALPQGWGHGGSWRRAVAAGGVSFNVLSPIEPEELDQPSGNAVFNGLPISVTLVSRAETPATAEAPALT